MPELVISSSSDEAIPSTSNNSSSSSSGSINRGMTFKEKIFGVRKHRRNPSDIEACGGTSDKRPSASGPSESNNNNGGIEETLYTPSFEKKALIFHGENNNLNNKQHSKTATNLGNANLFPSIDTISSTDKQCRICHSGVESRSNPLISPCRCSGTMQHVHTACLIRWLEVSSEKFWPTNVCELCGFKFKRHQFWRIRGIHFPSSTYQDRVLNFLFIFLICLMFICASIASSYAQAAETARFRATRVVRIGNTYFSGDEVTVVIAGVLFFMSFVLALCTQYRAGGTIFRQTVRFWTINRNWQIRDYNCCIDEEENFFTSRRQNLNNNCSINIEAALLPPTPSPILSSTLSLSNQLNNGSALP
uniref:RING-CH-type domain-containing protein n=1 Tax=Panagrolaimus sp. ES5 TaxID=591445 RepID=A0AC34FUI3_9BILA